MILAIISLLAGIVDGVAYQVHLAKYGVGFFDIVPLAVVWSYFKSFPGNLITVLTFGPWIVAFVCLRVLGRSKVGPTGTQRIARHNKRLQADGVPPVEP